MRVENISKVNFQAMNSLDEAEMLIDYSRAFSVEREACSTRHA